MQRSYRKWWFYEGKVREPRAEDLPGAAWVSGWARGRSVEVFQRHLGSSGEGLWDHFESKIVFSESRNRCRDASLELNDEAGVLADPQTTTSSNF